MFYDAGQQITENVTAQIGRDEFRTESFHEELIKNRPDRYLRYWGKDYPYLNENRNCTPGCMPIPENSDAQRFIRIRQNSVMMGNLISMMSK
jgi:hypothetical protein